MRLIDWIRYGRYCVVCASSLNIFVFLTGSFCLTICSNRLIVCLDPTMTNVDFILSMTVCLCSSCADASLRAQWVFGQIGLWRLIRFIEHNRNGALSFRYEDRVRHNCIMLHKNVCMQAIIRHSPPILTRSTHVLCRKRAPWRA